MGNKIYFQTTKGNKVWLAITDDKPNYKTPIKKDKKYPQHGRNILEKDWHARLKRYKQMIGQYTQNHILKQQK